jgi:glucokinase
VPTAVVVASLGLVDESAGIARRSAALGWQNVPLRDLVAARTGLPTVLGQDLRAAALAEATVGLGRIEPSFLFVAIGTGVGAALVRNRLVENGVRGLAGELGHIPVPPGRFGDSRPLACGCGAVGCLETVASATALRRRFRAADGTEISAAEVAGRATAGDAVAMAVWEDLVEGLACGLVTASALLDPGHIVLGGGVALAGEQLLAPLRERLGQRYRLADPPGLSVSSLTDRAAALGAGILGWRHLRTRSPRPGAPG